MSDDLAAANVNRSYQLAASSIAIFTFLLFFLYPRFASGQVDALRFQATLIVMGVATFSFAFASFYYYAASLVTSIDHPERGRLASRRSVVAARMRPAVPRSELDPLHGQASCRRLGWFALWLVYVLFVIRYFPRVQTAGTDPTGVSSI